MSHFTLKMYSSWLLPLLVYLLSSNSIEAIECFIQDLVNYSPGDSRMEKMVAPRVTLSSEEHTQCLVVHFFVLGGSRHDPGVARRLQPVTSKAYFDTENLLHNRCTLTGFTVDAPLYGAIVCACDEDFCNRMDYAYELLHSNEFGDIEKLASQALLNGTKGIFDGTVDDSKLECLARNNWTDYMLQYKNQLIVATGMLHECYQSNVSLEVPHEYIDVQKPGTKGQLETPYVSFDWLGNARFNTAPMTLHKADEKLYKPGQVTTFVIYGTRRLKNFIWGSPAPAKLQKVLGENSNLRSAGSSDETGNYTDPASNLLESEADATSDEQESSVLDEFADENVTNQSTTHTKIIFVIFNPNVPNSNTSSQPWLYVVLYVLLVYIVLLIIMLVLVWKRKLRKHRSDADVVVQRTQRAQVDYSEIEMEGLDWR